MLPLLRPRLSHKARYLAKLSMVTAAVHGVVLMSFLFWYRYETVQHVVNVQTVLRSDARIVLLPLHKRMALPAAASAVRSTVTNSTSTAPAQPKPGAKTAAKPAIKPADKRTKPPAMLAKPTAKKPTPAVKQPPKKTVAPAAKKVEQPAPKKPEKKVLQETKPAEPIKPAAPAQPAAAVPAPEPPAASAPIAPSIAPATAHPTPAPQAVPAADLSTSGAPAPEEIIYVGQEELDALELHTAVATALQTHWKVPPGLRPGLTCAIKVLIGFDGAVRSTEFEKKSGVLLFDMAAQTAVRTTTFPRPSWGKQLTLTF